MTAVKTLLGARDDAYATRFDPTQLIKETDVQHAIEGLSQLVATLQASFPTTGVDNSLVRFDGTTGALQSSPILLDDNGVFAIPTGGGFNWASSDVVISESANLLTFSGAASGYLFTGGPIALATGGQITFNAGDVTVTHSADLLTFAGAANGYAFQDGPLRPTANDGAALGTATLSFSDLFLASGAVVGWANGDVTLTHATDRLTFAGAANGYNFDNSLSVTSTDPGATINPFLILDRNSASPANSDALGVIQFTGRDSAANTEIYGQVRATAEIVTNGAEVGRLIFSTNLNGTITDLLGMQNGVFFPSLNDGASLGNGTFQWSDLFLANGGVINWANGNMSITHAAGSLSVNSGTFKVNGTGVAPDVFQIIDTDNGTFGAVARMIFATASPAANDVIGQFAFDSRNSSAAQLTYSYLRSYLLDPTAGSEDGKIFYGRKVNGADIESEIRAAGKTTIWIPCTALWKAIAAAGPSFLQFVSSSTNLTLLAYDPTAAIEDAFFQMAMPKDWDGGTVSFQFYWMHGSTTVNFTVAWEAFITGYSDGDAITGLSYGGTGSGCFDTGGVANTLYISPESGAVTIGNSPSPNDMVHLIFRREGGNASDTLAVDAYIIGVKMFYTSNAPNDL